MDLRQHKLTKAEWDFLEVPVTKSELTILKLIHNGYNDIMYTVNDSKSLLGFMRINNDSDEFHIYTYIEYFKSIISKLIKKYSLDFTPNLKVKKKLKKQDIIRLKNCSKKLDDIRDKVYEFILLDNIKRFFKKNFCPKSYYTLTQLLKNNILNTNKFVKTFVCSMLEKYKNQINKKLLVKNAFEYIEKNTSIFRFNDITLYPHQKSLFTSIKREGSKLILYQAPTGTGKTMSPVGLTKDNRVIFTCAAKHIGLQLAKACISLNIPIAIAFGCKDAGDIRLHYFAAKDYIKNRRTGGIFRVNNEIGDKVNIIITDIQSYLPAMNYMLAFNDKKDIVWYWDEPTITLDYDEHEFHEILSRNWSENEIPNVVLSSATLPNMDEILPMTNNFKTKFETNNVEEIISYECKKSIPILNSCGQVIMPHLVYSDFKSLRKCARHIENNKTILRHIDVEEMIRFITYVNKNNYVKKDFTIDQYFEDISDITIINLKIYYLRLLTLVKDNYEKIYNHFQRKRQNMHDSVIKITTNDSYTLTDGPTIFLTENVIEVSKFYLKVSNIPADELDKILEIMNKNELFMDELDKVEKEEQQRKDKLGSEQLEKDHSKNINSSEYKFLEQYRKKVEALKKEIKSIRLSEKYIPNSRAHIREWANSKNTEKAFTSDIDESVVEKIMCLQIENEWKILLLMGIGVFAKHTNKEYLDIMKGLASKQKLYLIIASSDYIYGTNYQFCHGYLSKGLQNMTQEKMLQAFGRVGRSSSQSNYTLRIRDDDLIYKLYTKDVNKPEVRNMNKLFT